MLGSPTLYDFIWCASILIASQVFVQIPCVRKRLVECIAKNPFDRIIVGIILASTCIVAGAKNGISPKAYMAQWVTALSEGVIVDESGAVARASESAVVEAFVNLAADINAGASNTVEQSTSRFAEVANMVTNTERKVIYLASFLPRSGTGQGAVTNHNIAATLERVRQSPDGLKVSAWIWFSEEPAFAPGIAADVDVGGGEFRLNAVTNWFPNTESVGGVPCVRYDFAVPQETAGTVLIPSYEVGFGSVGTPLTVPAGGISVITNGVTTLPFTGWDAYFGGALRVEYKGGIAVSATINGVAITNGVYSL